MVISHSLFRTLLPFEDFLWILQQEEYEASRYLKWLKRFYFRRSFVGAQKLKHTTRSRLILFGSIVLFIAKIVVLAIWFPSFLVLGTLLSIVFIPFWVLVAHYLLLPVSLIAHARVRTQAAALVRSYPNLRIIGIAGSYGKTTTKHFVYDLVRHRYKTQMIPGNINTITGIAQWLVEHLAKDTELLVLEMDAYKPGEIKATCDITPPTIAILTNVAEQHLERFGSLARLESTLKEIHDCLKPGGTFIADKKTIDAIGVSDAAVDITKLTYQGTVIAAEGLSESNRENLARVLRVAEVLEIPLEYVVDACAALTLPERRQKPGIVYGYDGIDDSYNITLGTAKAGLKAAHAFALSHKKKLLVLAAGIPELGPEEQNGNVLLGAAIAEKADHAVVFGSIFSTDIQKGIGTRIPVSTYPRLTDFLKEAAKVFPPSEWVLLQQPELNDLYY